MWGVLGGANDDDRERTKRAAVAFAVVLGACGPTGGESSDGPGEDTSSDGAGGQTGTTSTGTPTSWVPEFGRYSTWQKPGLVLSPLSVAVELLEFRNDGTLALESSGVVCFREPALHWEAHWVPEGDRIRLEGGEPGAPPDLWASLDEAWLEPGTDPASVNMFFVNTEGDLVGPSVYTPGCPCVPDPTMCCETGCEITLQTCPEGKLAAWCEPP
jgi:hypothetical protein